MYKAYVLAARVEGKVTAWRGHVIGTFHPFFVPPFIICSRRELSIEIALT